MKKRGLLRFPAHLWEVGEIALPRDEKLFAELVAIRWKPSASGEVQIESQDDLKGHLGRCSDRADAGSMVFYLGSVRGRGLRRLTPARGSHDLPRRRVDWLIRRRRDWDRDGTIP